MHDTRLPDQSAGYLRRREELRLAGIEFMQHTERVAALRRQLPAGPVLEDQVFQEGPRDLDAGDSPVISARLSDLFSGPGRSLVVYQSSTASGGQARVRCAPLWIDGWNGVAHHLAQNVDFVIAAAADPEVLRAHARLRTRIRILKG